ncbi:MAG: hypothetical protein Kow0069_00670 [Promethearchaeota archaeon]
MALGWTFLDLRDVFRVPWHVVDWYIFGTLVAIFVTARLKNRYARWSGRAPRPESGVVRESVWLAGSGGTNLHAHVYLRVKGEQVLGPGVEGMVALVWPARGKSARSLTYFGSSLAYFGVPVVVLDPRGHGRSHGRRNDPAVLEDARVLLDSLSIVCGGSAKWIFCVGFDLGASILVQSVAEDPRVVTVVAVSARYDLGSKWSKKFVGEGKRAFPPLLSVDPKVVHKIKLLHARDDRTASFEQFERFIEVHGVPVDNVLTFSKGGHRLFAQETLVVGATCGWLRNAVEEVGKGTAEN